MCVPARLQVKQAFVGKDHKGDVPLHLKIASGLTTGAIAITVASPTDLVKVRTSPQICGSCGVRGVAQLSFSFGVWQPHASWLSGPDAAQAAEPE